jgi:hypothetical protein
MCATVLEARAEARFVPTGKSLPACFGKPGCSGRCAAANLFKIRPEEIANENQPLAIASEFVDDILSPYKPHARYLKSAEIVSFRDKANETSKEALIKAAGRFSIPESCYIDDTGHFNAVEFNICYNQLAYVMFGKAVEAGIMERLRNEKVDVLSLPEFKRHQFPSMVIVSMESRYFKQLDSRNFRAELTVDKISSVGPAWFFFTTVTFADAEGVKAKGSVVLAYSPSFVPARKAS